MKILYLQLISVVFYTINLVPQSIQIEQLTNFNFNSRNPVFFNEGVFDRQGLVFEAQTDSTTNLILIDTDSHYSNFLTPMNITSGNSNNINPTCGFAGNKRIILWQTDINENWDIAMRVEENGVWLQSVLILSSTNHETNPQLISAPSNNERFFFVFEMDNSVFLYSDLGLITLVEQIFIGSDSIKYTQPVGKVGHLPITLDRFYGEIIAVQERVTGESTIVSKKRQWPDTLWSEIATVFDSGYCHNPDYNFLLSFESEIGGKNHVYTIHPDSFGINSYARRLLSDTSYETSHYRTLDSYGYLSEKNPRTFIATKNDSSYVFTTYGFHAWPFDTLKKTFVNTKIINAKSTVGSDGDLNFFTVWEDSSNGRINLFYVFRSDLWTSVENTFNEMSFKLFQNYPNPFNPTTKIRYEISERSLVTLKVYDVLGREVATLVNEEKPAGSYEVNFDATELTSGIYFYQLKAGKFLQTKKMILLR